MDLSEDQKARIREEERQRILEEQYRAQVRQELQNNSTPGARKRWRTSRAVLFSAAAIAVLCWVALMNVRFGARQASSTAKVRPAATAGTAVTPSIPAEKLSALTPPAPIKLTTAQIAERATPLVVVVENYNEDGEKASQGSGYVYSPDGIIITNYHVIRGATSVMVKLPSKGDDFKVESLLGYDIHTDVAALRIPAAAAQGLRRPRTATDTVDDLIRRANDETKRKNREYFAHVASVTGTPNAKEPKTTVDQSAESDGTSSMLATETMPEVKIGDHVVAIGAPLGLENTVSEGIISALRDDGGRHVIQTTASISPGSSGGPLFNDFGKVIGLTTATMRDGQSLNFVISSRHIADLLNQRRELSLSEMLIETKVSELVAATTLSVPARSVNGLTFTVGGQQGAVLEGSYTITGGTGKDVAVMLTGPGNVVIANSGRVSGFGQIRQRLPKGQYAIIFDNRFSNFSGKSVAPDLKLTYYK
jgi:S1-C subfamily serine protease